MNAVTELPKEARKAVRRDTMLMTGLLVAAFILVIAAAFVYFQTRNNDAVSRLTQTQNEAALCRAQYAADDAANLSHSQNVTLDLIKGLILHNFNADTVVKEIDDQVAKNNASADARANSVDTCQAANK